MKTKQPSRIPELTEQVSEEASEITEKTKKMNGNVRHSRMCGSYYQSVDDYSSNQLETPLSHPDTRMRIHSLKVMDSSDLDSFKLNSFLMLRQENVNKVTKPFSVEAFTQINQDMSIRAGNHLVINLHTNARGKHSQIVARSLN